MPEQIIHNRWKIFEPVLEDHSTTSFEYKKVYSPDHSNIDAVNVIKFEVKDLDAFIYPHRAYLQVGCVYTDKATGAAYADPNYKVAAQNNGSLLDQARLFIADKEIERVDYSSRVTHLRNLLDYSDDTTRSVSTDQLVFNDTGEGKTDDRVLVSNSVTTLTSLKGTTEGANGARIIRIGDAIEAGANQELIGAAGFSASTVTTATTTTDNSGVVNIGFKQRALITQGKTYYYRIPLARVFGFCHDYRSVLRGSVFRIELRRNIIAEILHGIGPTATPDNVEIGGAHEPVFKLDEMLLYMPYVKPSLPVLSDLETMLSRGGQMELGFNYYQTYGPYKHTNGILRQTITSLIERPSKIFVCLKDHDKHQKVTHNSLVYDNLSVTKMQIRAGSGVYYPDTPFEPDFVKDKYLQVWDEFLRASDKQHQFDGGSTVSYQSFKTLYPIFSFDLRESWKEVLFGSGSTVDITLEANLTAPANGYQVYVFMCSERMLNLDIVNRSMLLSVK